MINLKKIYTGLLGGLLVLTGGSSLGATNNADLNAALLSLATELSSSPWLNITKKASDATKLAVDAAKAAASSVTFETNANDKERLKTFTLALQAAFKELSKTMPKFTKQINLFISYRFEMLAELANDYLDDIQKNPQAANYFTNAFRLNLDNLTKNLILARRVYTATQITTFAVIIGAVGLGLVSAYKYFSGKSKEEDYPKTMQLSLPNNG